MDTQTMSIVGAGAMCTSIVSIVIMTVYYAKSNSADDDKGSGGGGGGGGGGSLPGKPMPIPVMKSKGPPWNILSLVKPERISSDGKTVKITYLANQQGMDSGAAFKAAPDGLPATTATLSYAVYFPPDFEWVKGGKLPGLCFGKTAKSCATGGEWQADAGSFRLMFRAQGQGIGYAYFPLKGGNEGSYSVQGTEYKKVADKSGGNTGHDIWYKKEKAFKFNLGAWNNVSMTVTMNAIGKNDGSVSVQVNGATRKISGMTWRTDPLVKICSVNFVSFYGGGDLSWACKKCTYTQYKDLKFSAIK